MLVQKFTYFFYIVLMIFICFISNTFDSSSTNSNNMLWPCPGFSIITSNFGYRDTPTSGATSYHNALDVSAPVGSSLIAISDGFVKYIGFAGSGGHTLIIFYNNGYTSTYCHISPNYIVKNWDYVSIGQLVGFVGPAYLDMDSTEFFMDNLGRKTNGATTGPHLHFKLMKDNIVIDPLSIEWSNK